MTRSSAVVRCALLVLAVVLVIGPSEPLVGVFLLLPACRHLVVEGKHGHGLATIAL